MRAIGWTPRVTSWDNLRRARLSRAGQVDPTMQHFYDWFSSRQDSRPWLVAGKGPTFDRRGEFDLEAYRLLGLNHVARDLPVEVSHAIDIDVIIEHGESIARNARYIVLPWRPHVGNQVGNKTLREYCSEVPLLERLDAEGRVLWYDLSTSPEKSDPRPTVDATFFSAEAAINLLANAGAKKIRSIGVDGGDAYSNAFADLSNVTRLNNGHPNYDLQFAGIARTIFRTGIDFAPVTEPSPVKVYVGAEKEQRLAVRVLDYSIKRHASMTTEVIPLDDCHIEFKLPEKQENRPRTPFSFHRFAIPELNGHRGKAIYVDSDMMVFQDIRKLWSLPFDGADLLAVGDVDAPNRRPQFSVMLLDCEALQWSVPDIVRRLDNGEFTYEKLMYDMCVARRVSPTISKYWNGLEHYEKGKTCLLHYTDMPRQPWINAINPLGYLFVEYLRDAIRDGFITDAEVDEHIVRGWVRPSLRWQLDSGPIDIGRHPGRLLLPYARWLDRKFVPPYKKLRAAKSQA
ncbi:MAG: glycosyltransferase [Gammaproteobacteria bacterium]